MYREILHTLNSNTYMYMPTVFPTGFWYRRPTNTFSRTLSLLSPIPLLPPVLNGSPLPPPPPVPERVAYLLFLSKVIFCVERPILSLMVSLRLDILAEEDTDTSKGRPMVGRTRMLIDRLRSLFPL